MVNQHSEIQDKKIIDAIVIKKGLHKISVTMEQRHSIARQTPHKNFNLLSKELGTPTR